MPEPASAASSSAGLSSEPPRSPLAMIDGAVTRALRFPADQRDPDVELAATRARFKRPRRAASAVGGTVDVLFLRSLGVRSGATRTADVEAAVRVFEAAGVRWIVTDDTVSSLNPLLDPGDLVVCHAFLDLHKQASVKPLGGKLVRLRDPYCPSGRLRTRVPAPRLCGEPRHALRVAGRDRDVPPARRRHRWVQPRPGHLPRARSAPATPGCIR